MGCLQITTHEYVKCLFQEAKSISLQGPPPLLWPSYLLQLSHADTSRSL